MHLAAFLPLYTGEITSLTSCLLSCRQIPSKKGVLSKRKEFAPMGSKFFPFRVDPFLEGRQNTFCRVATLEMHQFPVIGDQPDKL